MWAHGRAAEQSIYREVNRRIRDVSESWDGDDALDFLCECGDPDCTATFALTRAQFDGFTGDGGRLIASEHLQALHGKRLIAEHDGFVVVATR
jgi:hypothetical protein